jgi:molecular chaperone DnaK
MARDSQPRNGFGIDFGTTNSVAAVVNSPDPSRPAEPLLSDGRPHPSIVWYSPDGVVVGRQAKENFYSYADSTGHRFIRSVKKSLGSGKTFDVFGERLPATDVAARVFDHIKRHARASDGQWDIEEAVVTVPVGFDGRTRADIRRAANAADVRITTFVHEPFAAVVGHYRARGFDIGSLPDETVLVFDWGGGTLDITLTRTLDGRIEEIATGGLAKVAGDRFDDHLRDWARSRFLERRLLRPEAFSPSPRARDRFTLRSEQTKINLSAQQQDVLRVPGIAEIDGEVLDLREDVTRGDFEAMIRTDMQDALHQVDLVLDEARVAPEEVDRVLLIGGTSEIPLLRAEMERRFGVKVEAVPNSQTIIAEGAAAIAYYGYRPYLVRPVQLQLADGSALTIFDSGTLVPFDAEKQLTLFCTDNRDGEARLVVTEQSRSYDPSSVREQTILNVPVDPNLPRPYNHERVYATFRVDDDLILDVRAYGATREVITHKQVHDLKFGLRVR